MSGKGSKEQEIGTTASKRSFYDDCTDRDKQDRIEAKGTPREHFHQEIDKIKKPNEAYCGLLWFDPSPSTLKAQLDYMRRRYPDDDFRICHVGFDETTGERLYGQTTRYGTRVPYTIFCSKVTS